MTAAPVRVLRKGLWRLAPLTREQFREACLYAEAWVLQTTWKNVEALLHATAWCIGEQLSRRVSITLEGSHDIDDMPVVRIMVSEFQHLIAFRETRLVENDTIEKLIGDERIELIVEERLKAAKERDAARRKLGAGKKVKA